MIRTWIGGKHLFRTWRAPATTDLCRRTRTWWGLASHCFEFGHACGWWQLSGEPPADAACYVCQVSSRLGLIALHNTNFVLSCNWGCTSMHQQAASTQMKRQIPWLHCWPIYFFRARLRQAAQQALDKHFRTERICFGMDCVMLWFSQGFLNLDIFWT